MFGRTTRHIEEEALMSQTMRMKVCTMMHYTYVCNLSNLSKLANFFLFNTGGIQIMEVTAQVKAAKCVRYKEKETSSHLQNLKL